MLCDKSTDGRPCTDAETGEPCAQCQAAVLEQLRSIYRDMGYVRREVERLAQQLADMAMGAK